MKVSKTRYILIIIFQLSKGEIGVANFITPVNGASLGGYFRAKNKFWRQIFYT